MTSNILFIGAMQLIPQQMPTPSGWLDCDGSDVSRETHRALFEALGAPSESGDGHSTFTLPMLATNTVDPARYIIKAGPSEAEITTAVSLMRIAARMRDPETYAAASIQGADELDRIATWLLTGQAVVATVVNPTANRPT